MSSTVKPGSLRYLLGSTRGAVLLHQQSSFAETSITPANPTSLGSRWAPIFNPCNGPIFDGDTPRTAVVVSSWDFQSLERSWVVAWVNVLNIRAKVRNVSPLGSALAQSALRVKRGTKWTAVACSLSFYDRNLNL